MSGLARLNRRCRPRGRNQDGVITLCSHNRLADGINRERLLKLPGRSRFFEAVVEGEFPVHAYPAPSRLELKQGAQVMFLRNDSSGERRFFNGKIGRITAIEGEEITVQCPGEAPITVGPVAWENRKYSINSVTKEVSDSIVGTYTQHPLRLAWAITIHKSQGLTFERVVIDAEAAFAHGQVYVALSRCKSFEGIVLRSRIGASSVKTDTVVRNYTDQAAEQQPTAAELRADRYAFQVECLRDLFDFSELERAAKQVERVFLEHESSIQGTAAAEFGELLTSLRTKGIAVAEKFKPQLEVYFRNEALPAEQEPLAQRLAGASTYFVPYLRDELLTTLRDLSWMSDNQSVAQQLTERLENLERLAFTQARLFETVADGFAPDRYTRTRADAELDFARSKKGAAPRQILPKDSSHPELYRQLVAWRKFTADELDVPAYTIAPNRALLELVEVLPTSTKSLLRVTGFGKKRVADHGEAILAIVNKYLADHDLPSDQFQFAGGQPSRAAQPPKPSTKDVSLDLFRAGKSVPEIAAERGLVESTIFGHLSYWVGRGEIPAAELIGPEALDAIVPYLQTVPDASLSDVYRHFDEQYDYGVLRVARHHLARLEEE
jgi:hypothetical protein